MRQPDDMIVATPIWREVPHPEEIEFLRITDRNTLSPRAFCAPQSLDVSWYGTNFPEWKIERFPDTVFGSVKSYSLWLTAPEFYERFQTFEYVTICQLDAVLMRSLEMLELTDIDYAGAPWVPPVRVLTPGNRIYVASDGSDAQGWWITRTLGRRLPVGNGGLSIRRVDPHIRLTQWLTRSLPERFRRETLEDVLLCAFGPRTGLRVATGEWAEKVFLEAGAKDLASVPDVYGIHGLWRWNPDLARTLIND